MCPQPGVIILGGIAEDRAAYALRHVGSAGIVHVDAALFALGEDFFLCRGVFLHRPVEIKVILGQVREYRHIKVDARHALQRERMGGNLHHHMGAALLQHLPEQAVQLQTLGGGMFGVQELFADHVAVCADEADLSPRHRFQHMLHDVGGAGLAAGAGKADELHFCRRVAVEFPAYEGKAQAAVLYLNIGCAVRGHVLT